ncbi:sigma-70 family RNA polymerase sigma factor [Shinella sp. CPCC 101442]|uniref:sigma-70 family RNA polymerase sigma factor n=1 Tax=Shinella sp. CPCC 101442 TaxID=2932265 RepID=UPI0021521F33|nr:sigma-70 family RNA polymerase sigma factor [Shinella sp. CPCC 101442]MCR6501998.1 sigma-70 family RNA polymerase sigma factor [Shinella sp. CPCC 101442]
MDALLCEDPAQTVHGEIEVQLPALRRFAQRLTRSVSEREDLVQETVMRALRSSHQFHANTQLRSWLFTIMRNTFNTEYRRRCREPVGLDDGLFERLSISAPQEWAVRRSELCCAIGRLPPRSRRALLLVAMGVSYIDTARLCACEIGTVKSRVNRARKMLEDEIGRPSAP